MNSGVILFAEDGQLKARTVNGIVTIVDNNTIQPKLGFFEKLWFMITNWIPYTIVRKDSLGE